MSLGVLGLISSTIFNGLVFAGVYRFSRGAAKEQEDGTAGLFSAGHPA